MDMLKNEHLFRRLAMHYTDSAQSFNFLYALFSRRAAVFQL
jgi:hypothetical protein